MSSDIVKSFPAQAHRGKDINKQELNKLFLYNKSIDALVYAYFQDLSVPVEIGQENGKKIYETRVWKADLPNQQKICKKVRIGTTKTLRSRIKYMIDAGYIREGEEDGEEYYVLLNPESSYIHIPLNTLKFLIDSCSSQAIKVYIYLGQGSKMKSAQGQKYRFSREQLIETVKIPKTGGDQYSKINNILDCLINNGLIEIENDFNGKVPLLKLVSFNFDYKTRNR